MKTELYNFLTEPPNAKYDYKPNWTLSSFKTVAAIWSN